MTTVLSHKWNANCHPDKKPTHLTDEELVGRKQKGCEYVFYFLVRLLQNSFLLNEPHGRYYCHCIFFFFFSFQAKVSLLSELQSFLSLPVKTQAAVERKIIPLVFNSFTYLYSQEDISPLFSTVRMMRIFIMQHHLKSLLNVLHQKDEVNENWKSCCIHRR